MIRRLVLSLVLWSLATPAPAPAQDPPIDRAAARRAFAAAREAAASDGGRLWGVDLYGPILLVERGSRFLVGDRPDPEGRLQERDGIWTGALPESINPANTALDWAGLRWTMVLWPTPSLPHARNQLLLHELFHAAQNRIGLTAGSPANAHLDTMEGRIALRLEMRALARALVHENDARRAAVADALAFRAQRHHRFPNAAAEEDALERNEGMAEYTGLVLGGLPEAVLPDRAAVALEERERSDTQSRGFAYATGPAYGLLLDAVDPGWRVRLVQGTALHELLAEAYRWTADREDLDPALEPYGGERLIAIETARESTRMAQLEALRGRFLEGPTLRMTPGAEFRFSFNPNAAVTLDGHGTVYDPARVVDEWGILEVTAGGALFARNAQGHITGVVVPVAPDIMEAPTEGEGWKLQLAKGWEVAPDGVPGRWVVRRMGGP